MRPPKPKPRFLAACPDSTVQARTCRNLEPALVLLVIAVFTTRDTSCRWADEVRPLAQAAALVHCAQALLIHAFASQQAEAAFQSFDMTSRL